MATPAPGDVTGRCPRDAQHHPGANPGTGFLQPLVPTECQGLLQPPHCHVIAGRWDAGMGSGAAGAFWGFAPTQETLSCSGWV